MSIRFQKRLTLFPGVRVNFSLRGLSLTVGPKGANVNVGSAGTFLNLGIPGTGLAARSKLSGSVMSRRTRNLREVGMQQVEQQSAVSAAPRESSEARRAARRNKQRQTAAVETAYESGPAGSLTSPRLLQLKGTLTEIGRRRSMLEGAVANAVGRCTESKRALERMTRSPLLHFERQYLSALTQHLDFVNSYRDAMETALDSCALGASFAVPEAASREFRLLVGAFLRLAASAAVWDVTGRSTQDRKSTRSPASARVSRALVAFGRGEDGVLTDDVPLLRLGNANGGTILISPAFLLVRANLELDVIEIHDLSLTFSATTFPEAQEIPRDATRTGETWEKVNEDGSPDRRFKDNRAIPFVRYGELRLTTATGLNECYMASDARAAEDFAVAFRRYQDTLPNGALDAEPDDLEGTDDELPPLEIPPLPTPPPRPIGPRAMCAGVMLASALTAARVASVSPTNPAHPIATLLPEQTPAVQLPGPRLSETPHETAVGAGPPAESGPLTKAEALEAQKFLLRLGFLIGVPDGILGARTRRAVRDFRRQARMVGGDNLDRTVLAKLQDLAGRH